MATYSADPGEIEGVSALLRGIANTLLTANRHRTAEQALLGGVVGESYDRLRRSLYQDGVLNIQVIQTLSANLAVASGTYDAADTNAAANFLSPGLPGEP